jgi:hypothetical protein
MYKKIQFLAWDRHKQGGEVKPINKISTIVRIIVFPMAIQILTNNKIFKQIRFHSIDLYNLLM